MRWKEDGGREEKVMSNSYVEEGFKGAAGKVC